MLHGKPGRAFARLLVVLLVLVGVAPGLVRPAEAAPPRCGGPGTPSVVALHSSHFYVDASAQLLSGYAGYRVGSSTARKGLWLDVSGFTGGVIGPVAGQAPSVPLPDLTEAGVVRYLLLGASTTTTVPQSHTVTIYTGPPGTGVVVCKRTFTYADVVDTIKLVANKVDSVSSTAAGQVELGDAVTLTVNGHTGTLGTGPTNDPGVLSYTPNALPNFPASAWRLERTELVVSPDGVGATVTYVDGLTLTGATGPNRPFTARYTYRAIGPAAASTPVRPVQYIANGTLVKHTNLGASSAGSLPAVSTTAAVTVTEKVTSPADGVLPGVGGTADYSVRLVNSSASARTVDSVSDVLPAAALYSSGSLALDGRPILDPTVNNGVLTVRGPITVPAAGETELTYSLQFGSTPGPHSSSATARYGQATLDTSADVTDSAPASATVTVLGSLNLVDDAATAPTGTGIAVAVLSNDSTSSGLPLKVTSLTAPNRGNAILGGDGSVTYMPSPGTSGTDSFTYTATDGYTSASATVVLTVTPVLAQDVYSTGENTTLFASSVLPNDACGGCTASTSLVSPPATGAASMAADGTFTYTPASNTTGPVTFIYSAMDNAGSSSEGIVTIYVGDLGPDFATTSYGDPVVVPVKNNDLGCAGGCEPQADTDGSRGTVTYSGGSPVTATYTPTAGLWGLDSFTYGTTTGSTLTPVTVLTEPPTTVLQTTYGVTATAQLPANGSCAACTYSLDSPPTHGAVTVDATTGTSTFTPEAGFVGIDAYTYAVEDPVSGLRVLGLVDTTVGPLAVGDSASVLLGSTANGAVSTNDFCPATCTLTKLTDPTSGTVVFNNDGTFSYTPGSAIGQFTFTYRVTSSVSGSASSDATVTVTVRGAVDDVDSTTPNTPVDIAVRGNDPCAACTMSVDSTSSGTTTIIGQAVRYTPVPGFSGRATFSYTLTLGAATTTAVVTVTVTPLAVADTAIAVVGKTVDLQPLGNDLCANCAITSLGTPTSGSVQQNDDVVTFTPSSAGAATFTYDAIDGIGNTFSGAVAVTVVDPPVLAADAITVASGQLGLISLLDNDSCADCTVAVATDPLNGSITMDVGGQIGYTAAPGFSGLDSFTYTATDPATGAHANETVAVTVSPTARDDTANTPVEVPISVDVLANDACKACTLAVGTTTGDVVANVVSGQLEVMPNTQWVGTATVEYTATDPATALATTATLTVEVNNAQPDAITVAPGGSVTGLDVLANDLCPSCTITAVTTATHGTPVNEGNTVGWTPPTGFAGLATFGYSADDGSQTVASTVRILVTPPPLPVNTTVDQHVTVQPPATGSCPGCELRIRTSADEGDIDYDGSGFRYTPPPGYTGPDVFTYRLTDPVSRLWVEANVVITVAAPPANPALSITPTPPTPGSPPHAGDVLPWTWTVANTGDVPLTGVTPTGATCAATTLAVGANTPCTTSHTVSQGEIDAGQLMKRIDVTASSSGGPVSDYDESTVLLARVPGLGIDATASLGTGVVTVTYTVENTGNTTLSAVGVTLTDSTVLSCTTTSVLPGGQVPCTGTHNITPSDVQAGSWSSNGTGSATAPGTALPLTATDSTTTPLSSPPHTTVSGKVWIDRNLDGQFQADEWPLPGIAVALAGGSTRMAAAESSTVYAISGVDGQYSFENVEMASYTISAVFPDGGFTYTSDPDGPADWSANLAVSGSPITAVNFAGTGQGTIRGTVHTRATRAPVPDPAVVCVWAGLDHTLHTADDVTMSTTGDTAGSFTLSQLPFGAFSCDALDQVSGVRSSPVLVDVQSTTPVDIELPVGEEAVQLPADPVPAPADVDDPLADTGPWSPQVFWLGILLVLTGAGTVLATRRRQSYQAADRAVRAR
ncbi:Ig-like domain-containing protein [Actinokineospora diospyrosa]|uniref:DUF7507 domain-containing protein n=1 Tax=Actinokineospora diospyrosa TaxID=103728 RepID=A0ABT1IKD5_9PSEU|nr:Ig-like domain-containing protein [Actinokineospora diospyrosa]MCP2273120.1 hypothetical protein [Actinokineospora diospyrosa]